MNKENDHDNSREIDGYYHELLSQADASAYHLNPDEEFVKDLIAGLLTNVKRYGYASCPCRLAAGNEGEDRDIVCPCDYRDPDLVGHGACYCALYVSDAVLSGEKQLSCVPERRPPREKRAVKRAVNENIRAGTLSYPVWRCKVCGYLCAREAPPETCPVCKAKKDRFERFI